MIMALINFGLNDFGQNGLIILTLEEIETIISEATPTNTKRATACAVLYYSFDFLLVKFNDFNTAIEMHIF